MLKQKEIQELKKSMRPESIEKFSARYPMKNGINYLPPNQKVFPIVLTYAIGKPEIIEFFDVSIKYLINKKDSKTKNFRINLREFIDIEQMGEGWLGKIAYELKQLNNNLSAISGKLK